MSFLFYSAPLEAQVLMVIWDEYTNYVDLIFNLIPVSNIGGCLWTSVEQVDGTTNTQTRPSEPSNYVQALISW